MKRRDFVVGGVGASLALPAFGQGQREWQNDFIDKWVTGSWQITFVDWKLKDVLMEFYSYSASTEERGAFRLRGGMTWMTARPSAMKNAVAKPGGSGAKLVGVSDDGKGRYEFDWRAADTQEGTCTSIASGEVSKVRVRRLSTAEIDEQRRRVLGEKPTLINTSYFG